MAKKKIDYLGYDPGIIDAWFQVYEECTSYRLGSMNLYQLIGSLPQEHRRVVASMLTLSRWIMKSNYEHDLPCALCALRVSTCWECPFKEVFPDDTCGEAICSNNVAEMASKIYANEYRKVFGG